VSAPGSAKVQTTSGLFAAQDGMAAVAARFPLPWSHYVRLLAVRNPEARRFYEAETLRGGWTIRQLDRQIGTNSTNAQRCLGTRPQCSGVARRSNRATR